MTETEDDPFRKALSDLPMCFDEDNLSRILSEIKTGVSDKLNRKENTYRLSSTKGTLERLITCLELREEKLLSLTLSVLADCFLHHHAAREAVKRHNVLPQIGRIMKENAGVDVILGRVCRIVTNLCRHNDRHGNEIVENEAQYNIIGNIVRILSEVLEKEEMPHKSTVMMALSALYQLIKNTGSSDVIIRNYGVVKGLGCLIVTFMPNWVEKKKNHDVLMQVLKVLELCSKSECRNILNELRNTGKGDAMILLSDLILMNSVTMTVRNIVQNLQKLCIYQSDLPLNEIFAKLIEKLNDTSVYSKGTEDLLYTNFLHCLCHLARAKTLWDSLIVAVTVALMKVLKSYTRVTEVSLKNCKMAVVTLRQQHFTNALRLMLHEGILAILSDKLDWILNVEEHCFDLRHRCLFTPLAKREGDANDLESEDEDETTHTLNKDLVKVFNKQLHANMDASHAELIMSRCSRRKRRRSPSPSTREYTLSPTRSLSPAASPAASTSSTSDHDECDEDQSEMSLYSDVEEDNEQQSQSAAKDCKGTMTKQSKDIGNTRSFNILAWEIVNLIKCFVNLKPIALEIASSDIIYKLLLFFLPKNESFKPPRLKKIIINVIKSPENLINLLMHTRLIYVTYKFYMPRHSYCCLTCIDHFAVAHLILSTLTKVVEGTSGKGDIAHKLYRADLSIKQKLVVTVPFVSEKISTLNNLLIKCGGLDILVNLVQDPGILGTVTVCGLAVLARKLQIKDPTNSSDLMEWFDDNYAAYEDSVTATSTLSSMSLSATNLRSVIFKLDDDSCVHADREFLSSKSEYFNQLLFGQFKESHQEVVRLSKVSDGSLKLILTLLQRDDLLSGGKLYQSSGDNFLKHVELAMLLEAIALSDRFLLEKLSSTLTLFVQYYRFTPASVPRIYSWAIESGTNILRVEIVAYCLVGFMSEEQRYGIFEKLIASEYCDYFTDDIKDMLRRFLYAA